MDVEALESLDSPIAPIESLWPRRRHRQWLGPVTLPLLVALYAAACALVTKDAYATGEATATWGQLVGSAAVATGLVVAGPRVGRRPAGAFALLATPIGDVDDAEKSGHNVALLLLVLLLTALAARQAARGGPERRHVPA